LVPDAPDRDLRPMLLQVAMMFSFEVGNREDFAWGSHPHRGCRRASMLSTRGSPLSRRRQGHLNGPREEDALPTLNRDDARPGACRGVTRKTQVVRQRAGRILEKAPVRFKAHHPDMGVRPRNGMPKSCPQEVARGRAPARRTALRWRRRRRRCPAARRSPNSSTGSPCAPQGRSARLGDGDQRLKVASG